MQGYVYLSALQEVCTPARLMHVCAAFSAGALLHQLKQIIKSSQGPYKPRRANFQYVVFSVEATCDTWEQPTRVKNLIGDPKDGIDICMSRCLHDMCTLNDPGSTCILYIYMGAKAWIWQLLEQRMCTLEFQVLPPKYHALWAHTPWVFRIRYA